MEVKSKRKSDNTCVRPLHLANQNFIENISDEILTALPNYEASIALMKKQGYKIVGYGRKSPGKEALERQNAVSATFDQPSPRAVTSRQDVISPCCKSNHPIYGLKWAGHNWAASSD
ncbi:hypothetical protein EC973_004988 [Apophysomyces ossiformis]|uniref:Uncharacterized protein n=1 Tax=Apophysomyces ossiformis TaxID=679940 RepID=A0A8H7BKP9_9FUNG|nr:hypothetical protein EC973_004988 [Apophysomyces ossiformis]